MSHFAPLYVHDELFSVHELHEGMLWLSNAILEIKVKIQRLERRITTLLSLAPLQNLCLPTFLDSFSHRRRARC